MEKYTNEQFKKDVERTIKQYQKFNLKIMEKMSKKELKEQFYDNRYNNEESEEKKYGK